MPTWSGWVNQFLTAGGVIITPPNRTFMEAWAAHAPGSCQNNPVDLSQAVAGSSRCGDTVAGFGRSQKYGTHAEAARAFHLQLHTDWVKPLLDALNTGNPFQIGDRTAVVDAIKRWGSPAFAKWYANATTSGTSGGGGGGSGSPAHAHGGWNDLRHTVNHGMPKTLRHSHRNIEAALRALSRARKVHL